MPRSHVWRAVSLAAVLLAVCAVPAGAHQGNPNFRSVIRSVTPGVPGLQVQVLGFDSELELTNRTGRAVTIYGYNGEPYARLLADGTVQTNTRSPAVYLNEDRFGTTPVPVSAKPSLPPRWRTLDKTGRFVWHDHRMHWMAPGTPPKVHDTSRRTKIFDYRIPLQVGTGRGAVGGTLYWVGSPAGFPLAALVSLVVVLALAVGLVVAVRRRRGAGTTAPGQDGAPPTREAW
ncbi:MAG TPA: hypothetical protein VE972_09660 [Conexibacter sp.]|nr:hypothetical protein [Conexibacter sp.]